VLNPVCYVSLCEGLRAGAGSLSYIVHVDCCSLSTIVIKNVINLYTCLGGFIAGSFVIGGFSRRLVAFVPRRQRLDRTGSLGWQIEFFRRLSCV